MPLGQFGSNIFFAQPFLSLVVFNSITDAAFITWFLKRWFCKSRQFLDITQSKYVIIWWQCLKFVQIFILGCAGQIEVQKCPSLTKFLPITKMETNMPHYTQYSTIIQLMAINFHSWTKPFKWTLQDWSMCHHQIVFTSLQALINIFYTLMRLCLVILMNSEQAIFCIITSANVETNFMHGSYHVALVFCLLPQMVGPGKGGMWVLNQNPNNGPFQKIWITDHRMVSLAKKLLYPFRNWKIATCKYWRSF